MYSLTIAPPAARVPTLTGGPIRADPDVWQATFAGFAVVRASRPVAGATDLSGAQEEDNCRFAIESHTTRRHHTSCCTAAPSLAPPLTTNPTWEGP